MFQFELLPNEMQLEVLKRTEFQTVQSMKKVSKRVQKFIQVYQKYMMPIPIRQMFVTPNKISFTLSHSTEVCTISPDLLDVFLKGANVDLLWLEMNGSENEPMEHLQVILQKTSFSQVKCLKLGSSKVECDVEKLKKLMKSLKCSELIVDWRFRLPENFFVQFPIEMLSRLTIGSQESRNFYHPLSGESFRKFQGDWLELGRNRLTSTDFSEFFKTWKSGSIRWISMYNIVLSLPISEILQVLKNETCQKTSSQWIVSRDDEELEINFLANSNFSKLPSLVIRQFQKATIF